MCFTVFILNLILQDLEEDDQNFVVEVFSGCVRYHQVLDVVTAGFYNRDGKNVLRSEENLYKGE